MYKDAIDTVSESKSSTIADDLLKYFVGKNDSESFCAMLYTCYDLVSPDVAIELAWRHDLTDHAMPYVINYVHELEKRLKELEAAKPKKKEAADDFQEDMGGMAGGGPMMLANTAFNGAVPGMQTGVPQMGGMQPGMGGMGMQQPGMGGMGMQQPGMGGMGMQQPGMGGMGMQQGMGGMGGMPNMPMGMDAMGSMGGGF